MPVDPEKQIRIIVWAPARQTKTYHLIVSNLSSVFHVKEKLVECGVKAHPSDQDLIFDNQSLEDRLKLSDYKIKHLSMLRLTIFLSQSGKPSAHRGDPGGRARSRSRHLLSPPRFVSDSDELARDAVADVRPAGDAVADVPATASGRRRDCVVMTGGTVFAGDVNDVRKLMSLIIGRQ